HESHRRALARAQRFVDEFVPGAANQRGLIFCGPPGTGKTHLLSAMLRDLAAQKGVRVRYAEFFYLLSDIKDGFSSGISSRESLDKRVGARIYSRLHEMCDFVDVLGMDERKGQHDVRQAKDDSVAARGWTRSARG